MTSVTGLSCHRSNIRWSAHPIIFLCYMKGAADLAIWKGMTFSLLLSDNNMTNFSDLPGKWDIMVNKNLLHSAISWTLECDTGEILNRLSITGADSFPIRDSKTASGKISVCVDKELSVLTIP